MYMLIQDTQNDLYIDNDHKIRPRRLTLNNVWIIDSINLFHLLVNSIYSWSSILSYMKIYTYFCFIIRYAFTLSKLFSNKKRYKRLLSRIDHADIMALILVYDKRYAKTALYDRLQPYHNYAKKFSFYSIFQREPLKIAA